jgi:PAS domain S-box-containing protein
MLSTEQIFDLWPDAAFLIALGGRIARANTAAAQLVGCAKRDLEGRDIAAFFATPRHAQAFMARLETSCAKPEASKPRWRRMRMRSATGEAISVRYLLDSEIHAEGQTVLFVRKSAIPAQAEASEDISANGGMKENVILPLVAKYAEDCVIITDALGRIIWANTAAQKMSGYSLVEMLGQKPGVILQGANTDPLTVADISRALAAGESVQCDIMNYHKSGRAYWIDMAISPIRDASGKVESFISISREITEKKAREMLLADAPRKIELAEARLAAAIEAISEGFVIYDDQDRLVMANSAYRKMREADADLLVPGATFEDIVRTSVMRGHYDTRGEDTENWIARQVEARKKGRDVETLVQFSDGRWMLRRERRTAQGEMIGIRSDVTEFKTQEAELQKARHEAEMANRAKSDFVANISHELRTPINGIMGFNQIMLANDLSPKQRERALCIKTASEDLLRLVNDLLDLSKMATGTIDLRIAPFDLIDLLEENQKAMKPLAEQKNIDLSLAADLPPGLVVEGDRARIKQILMNLIGNAVKFTDEGRVGIRADLRDGGVCLEVSDTGPGIPEEQLENVFDRFARLHAGPALREGAGLGLSITQKLVELMGGKIKVASALGRGSTFSVWLPLAIVASAHVADNEPGRTKTTQDAEMTMFDVLVAEDHPMNQRLINDILDAIGCRVTIAEDGAKALAHLDTEDFDLVIMDHQMPVMTGLDAIRAIRSRTDWKMDIPIIALTANAMRGSETVYSELGVDEFMTKPLMLERVIGAVRRLGLAGRKLRGGQPPAHH